MDEDAPPSGKFIQPLEKLKPLIYMFMFIQPLCTDTLGICGANGSQQDGESSDSSKEENYGMLAGILQCW